MRAMLLEEVGPLDPKRGPLTAADIPCPKPGKGEVLIRVSTCGVCHTELDEIEGRTPPPTLPVVPGHQIVGRVEACGEGITSPTVGTRVGVAWINSACGTCSACRAGYENICPQFRATGRDVNGGYAEFVAVPAAFTYVLPDMLTDEQTAPLLCAGAVGYRSLRLANLRPGGRLGLTGFGASGHLVLKLMRLRRRYDEVYVFARSEAERVFAMELGATWAGDTTTPAPVLLDAIIDTTPAWLPVVEALGNLAPGGRLVINAIRKESADRDVLATLDYPRHLWMEKEIKSVANVTRQDVAEFIEIAGSARLFPEVEEFDLADANRALRELKLAHVRGAKVLRVS
jgi:alcohol dehydrogenase, propanol-preferring